MSERTRRHERWARNMDTIYMSAESTIAQRKYLACTWVWCVCVCLLPRPRIVPEQLERASTAFYSVHHILKLRTLSNIYIYTIHRFPYPQAVFAFQMTVVEPTKFGEYVFPDWADALGWLVGASTLMPFFGCLIYQIFIKRVSIFEKSIHVMYH